MSPSFLLVILAISVTNVIALECRYGMSIHFAHTKKIQLKEKKIFCESEDDWCGRVTLQARADDKNVTVHTASCMDEKSCAYDKRNCSVSHLHNITDPGDFQQIYSCRTKCCNRNNCNFHGVKPPNPGRRKRPKKVKHQHRAKHPSLKCYTGIREHDHKGNLLKHELEEKTCLYPARGGGKMSQSRCMSAQVVARENEPNSLPLITTISHCLHLTMCKSLTCDDMEALLTKDENIIVERCNITCCSDDFCNRAVGNNLPNLYLWNFTFAVILTFFYTK